MSTSNLFDQLKNGQSLSYQLKRGLLKISGPDALSFLQRMSSNDLALLSPNTPVLTCFVDNKGKLVDLALVLAYSDQEFILISSHEHSQILHTWLDKYHFIEQFSLNNIFDKELYFICQAQSITNLGGSFFASQVQADLKIYFYAQLLNQQPTNLNPEPSDSWPNLSIASFMPQAPHEICENYMPQNVGLNSYISATKGCYIGQEVIAKAITYQKNSKYLVGAKLDHSILKTAVLGDKLIDKSGHIARITSLAPHYFPGVVNVLAICESRSSVSQDKPCSNSFTIPSLFILPVAA